jgi:hypothetical protein
MQWLQRDAITAAVALQLHGIACSRCNAQSGHWSYVQNYLFFCDKGFYFISASGNFRQVIK